jgi:peptidylprolyl isomerase
MFLKRFIFLFILTIFTGNAMAENENEKLLIELSHGDVVVELHSDIAPLHVDRIKTLAKDGFYDGIIFHRVIEGFMAQTGDPTGTGYGGSDYPDLRAEFSNKPFERGTIGMARSSNPNSGNSQFFICFEPAPFLNGQYTVWGTVIEGMENVDKIARGEPPANPDKIIKMTVVE